MVQDFNWSMTMPSAGGMHFKGTTQDQKRITDLSVRESCQHFQQNSGTAIQILQSNAQAVPCPQLFHFMFWSFAMNSIWHSYVIKWTFKWDEPEKQSVCRMRNGEWDFFHSGSRLSESCIFLHRLQESKTWSFFCFKGKLWSSCTHLSPGRPLKENKILRNGR